MTDSKELKSLIAQVRYMGYTVNVTYEDNDEGRKIVDTVQIVGMKGAWRFPMSALSAAERMRGIVAKG